MDLGAFVEEVRDAVAGICGDVVVETQTQAAHVLDALLRRPGTNRHELAAVFGISFEQLERCRAAGRAEAKDSVYDNICQLDAVYAWNVLIQRINQAAHWHEEFRDMWNDEDASSGEENDGDEIVTSAQSLVDTQGPPRTAQSLENSTEHLVLAETRKKARALFSKYLDAPTRLKKLLIRRLDEEVAEHFPDDRDYRHCVRSLAANLRRNTMLAAGYSSGRVPPQWMVLCDAEALAPRTRQLQRRVLRNECLKEVRLDDETAELKRRAWVAARGTDLAPPPPHEDPFGNGKKLGVIESAT